MTKGLQSVRGMSDILPGETAVWQAVESVLKGVAAAYGYRERGKEIAAFLADRVIGSQP